MFIFILTNNNMRRPESLQITNEWDNFYQNLSEQSIERLIEFLIDSETIQVENDRKEAIKNNPLLVLEMLDLKIELGIMLNTLISKNVLSENDAEKLQKRISTSEGRDNHTTLDLLFYFANKLHTASLDDRHPTDLNN